MTARSLRPREIAVHGVLLALVLGILTGIIWLLVGGREASQGGFFNVVRDDGVLLYGTLALASGAIGYALGRGPWCERSLRSRFLVIAFAWLLDGVILRRVRTHPRRRAGSDRRRLRLVGGHRRRSPTLGHVGWSVVGRHPSSDGPDAARRLKDDPWTLVMSAGVPAHRSTRQSRGDPRCQTLEVPSISASVRVDTAPIAIR